MAIALPEISSLAYLRALKDYGITARLIASETGDLSYSRINDLQRLDAARRVAWNGLMEDVNAGFTSVIVGFLNARGVPGTASEIAAAHNALTSAQSAWQLAVRGAARASADMQVKSLNQGGGETLYTIAPLDHIPGATANPLRASAELTALVTALDGLGA